ncbi:MAG: DUF2845 domain-containing protein [Syntrophobacteraceae bacterium]|nr:DUF2845 domain-containing protein [Syntrophobacteraceae bacterium]
MLCALCPAFGADKVHDLTCQSGTVRVGDNKIEVLSQCGEPSSKDSVEQHARGVTVTIEQWTYNLGAQDFIYVLDFNGATLKAIRRGERGF